MTRSATLTTDIDGGIVHSADGPPARVGWWLVPGVAAVVVVVGVVWGWQVQSDPNVKLGAAPVVGEWRIRFGWSLVAAAALAAATAWFGPNLASRLRFRWVTLASALASVIFTLLLAASDGWGHVLDPVVHRTEYWANLATLPDAGTMLQRYDTLEFLLNYSVHAKGHPVGFLLLLKALAAIGLGAPWVTGALSYLGVAAVVAAVLCTVSIAVDQAVARRLAPFLVVAPYAVWMGTSADAFFAGVAATGVLVVVLSSTSATTARRIGLAVLAGVILGSLLMMTYGAAVFGLIPAVFVIGLTWPNRRRAVEVLAGIGMGTATVLFGFGLAGFSWFHGLGVTKQLYWWGTAQFRPAGYFAVGNLAAALIALGPAVAFGLGRLRDRRIWLVVGAGLLAIAVADASQYSKAEVERIWLIFFPWAAVAAVAMVRSRRWIAIQAAVAIGLQLALVSKW